MEKPLAPNGSDDESEKKLKLLVEYSQNSIAKGSKTFWFASRFLRSEIQMGVVLLYAWCRFCDDEIDGAEKKGTVKERLEALKYWTHAAYNKDLTLDEGVPAEVHALRYVVNRFNIPAHYPLELIEGMAMDVEGQRFETLDDLMLYAYRVAGVVGLMMIHIMGISDERALKNATDLGNAFQLTNISRDILEDAGLGRIYLPLSWLREAGIPLDAAGKLEYREKVVKVVKRLLDEADKLYISGQEGIQYLSFWTAFSIAASRWIYAAIGVKVCKRGSSAWDERVYVPFIHKVGIALRALWFVLTQIPRRIISPWRRAEITTVWKFKPSGQPK